MQALGELGPLALAQAAERLARRDLAALQNLGGLRPYLGRASSMSKTFAVSRYGGGSSSSGPIDTLPALRSRLSCARSARTSLAAERVHALIQVALGCHPVLEGVLVGDDIGAETTRAPSAPRPETPAPMARFSHCGHRGCKPTLCSRDLHHRRSATRFVRQVCILHRPHAQLPKATKSSTSASRTLVSLVGHPMASPAQGWVRSDYT